MVKKKKSPTVTRGTHPCLIHLTLCETKPRGHDAYKHKGPVTKRILTVL